MTKLWVIGLVAFCSILGAVGQLFFKLGSESLSMNIMALLGNWKLMMGLVCYGLATVLFVFALKQGNLSILYPIIALSYVWVTLLSKFFLKEAFPGFKWVGIFFIILGVFIIQLEGLP